MWNLIPADSSVNSSKNDKIPDVDFFLPKYAAQHQLALNTIAENGVLGKKFDVIMEDYSVTGASINELLVLSEIDFAKKLHEVFAPLAQIAINMGFEPWSNHG